MNRGPKHAKRKTTELLMVGKSEGRQLRGDRRNGSIIYFLLFKSPLRGLTGSHGLLLLDGCLS